MLLVHREHLTSKHLVFLYRVVYVENVFRIASNGSTQREENTDLHSLPSLWITPVRNQLMNVNPNSRGLSASIDLVLLQPECQRWTVIKVLYPADMQVRRCLISFVMLNGSGRGASCGWALRSPRRSLDS